jgi:hypothetical protein
MWTQTQTHTPPHPSLHPRLAQGGNHALDYRWIFVGETLHSL